MTINHSRNISYFNKSVSPDEKSLFLKWDGQIYEKIEIDGQTLLIDDVWEMLDKKQFDKVSSLLTKQPNIINSLRGGYNEYTLMMKAANIQRKDCVEFLSKKPHDVSVVDEDGENVLHYIVLFYNDDVAIEMLKCLDVSQLNNNFINQQNNNKRTPLHDAAMLNRHKSIRWLLKNGADVSLKDDDGLRPYEYHSCYDETKRIILQY